MSTELLISLIGASVAIIGVVVTLVIGLKTIRTERDRLTIERERIQAEVQKLSLETEKIKSELDETRRQKMEEKILLLDIERIKATDLVGKRNVVYPKLLELAYRIRNYLRDNMKPLSKIDLVKPNSFNPYKAPFVPYHLSDMDHEVYLLTEALYEYKAIIDNEVFIALHRFKHLAQDARVLTNRASRNFDGSQEVRGLISQGDTDNKIVQKSFEEERLQIVDSYSELRKIYIEMEEVYSIIAKHIETYF